MRLRLGTLLLCGSTLLLPAQEANLDDLLGGFDDTPALDVAELDIPKAETPETSWLSAYGDLSFATAYNYAHEAPEDGQTDYRGLSRARTEADLTLDAAFQNGWRGKLEMELFYDAVYRINGRDDYTDEVLDEYETEAEINEAYLQGSPLNNFDLKIGRQIVVWGKSDNIRITDVINPLDNREPGMIDIEDLRLPVVMTKADYYLGAWNLSAMLIHESRVQKEVQVGSDFLPIHLFPLPGGVFPDAVEPDSKIGDPQLALAANGRFSGWDLSLYAARVLDGRWYLHPETSGGFTRRYDRMNMVGLAANVALGNWLLKTEGAHLSDLRYSSVDGRKKRLDLLVGTEYTGMTDTTLSLEIANRHLYDYEAIMENAPNFAYEDEQQLALRGSYSFNHDKGMLSLLLSRFFADGDTLGGLTRFWMDYELSDGLNGSIGLVDYTGGAKAVLDALKDNDRVFADITYSFGL